MARAPRRGLIEDLALVLAAQQIPYEVRPTNTGWVMAVPLDWYGAAAAALAAYEADATEIAPDVPSESEDLGPSQVGTLVGIALLAFHGFVALGGQRMTWVRAGRASAERIVGGEIWRCMTALTLHADPLHVASNAVAGAVFGNLLARSVGAGVTITVMLTTGVLGNLINAYWRDGVHLSLGFSTSVFGLVGALAGLQAGRYRAVPRWSRRAWVPLAGAVALLAMLGSSPQSDFVAHVGGLLAGLAHAPLLIRAARRPLAPKWQWAATVVTLTVVVLSWAIAFRG